MDPIPRDISSSPELPLAASHGVGFSSVSGQIKDGGSVGIEVGQEGEARFSDGEIDLLGSLERHLEGRGNSAGLGDGGKEGS